jgi:hypothetical protein
MLFLLVTLSNTVSCCVHSAILYHVIYIKVRLILVVNIHGILAVYTLW